jgi:membrane associated rhomboid family serine protease
MFLHGGWWHLIANMWALWLFGDNVEDALGHGRFLVFYLTCGVAAAVVHSMTDPSSTLPSVGASGAIAGVLGAYLLFFPAARIITLVPIVFIPWVVEIPAFLYLGFGFSPNYSMASPPWGWPISTRAESRGGRTWEASWRASCSVPCSVVLAGAYSETNTGAW